MTDRQNKADQNFLNSIKSVLSTELHFDCSDDIKFEILEKIRTRLLLAGVRVDTTLGIRISNNDGWWLLRASTTRPELIAQFESNSEMGLQRLKSAVTNELIASNMLSTLTQ